MGHAKRFPSVHLVLKMPSEDVSVVGFFRGTVHCFAAFGLAIRATFAHRHFSQQRPARHGSRPTEFLADDRHRHGGAAGTTAGNGPPCIRTRSWCNCPTWACRWPESLAAALLRRGLPGDAAVCLRHHTSERRTAAVPGTLPLEELLHPGERFPQVGLGRHRTRLGQRQPAQRGVLVLRAGRVRGLGGHEVPEVGVLVGRRPLPAGTPTMTRCRSRSSGHGTRLASPRNFPPAASRRAMASAACPPTAARRRCARCSTRPIPARQPHRQLRRARSHPRRRFPEPDRNGDHPC